MQLQQVPQALLIDQAGRVVLLLYKGLVKAHAALQRARITTRKRHVLCPVEAPFE